MKNGKKHKKIQGFESTPSITEQRLAVFEALQQVGAKYILIGGVACNFHGLVRATKDIDLLIPKGDVTNTQLIFDALNESQTWGLVSELDAEECSSKPFTIIGDQPRVDLLTVAGKISFEQAIKSVLKRNIEGVSVCVADIDTLLKTKDTGRLSDKIDVEQLKEIKKQVRLKLKK